MPKKSLPVTAYFCMEYGLASDFSIYAGGLGILAGDILKTAHDVKFPMVGVGILWRQGYTTQMVSKNGQPFDAYPIFHYDFLKDTGIKIKVLIRGRQVACKVWSVDHFKNAPLYLLDTNLPENDDPWISGQLYGWFGEERIAQEMVLGIGGVRALRALGIKVDIYHFNEGHALFAGLELIREKMEKGMSFQEAWTQTKKQIVFTTHTPVKEGNEQHDHEMLKYMGAYNGLTHGQMLSLGGDPFNMTVGCLRLAKIANGVSELHGHTARNMWELIPQIAPLISITNGIHLDTWQNLAIRKAFENNQPIWPVHLEAKERLIRFVQAKTGVTLDKNSLIIGFARRAAPYKRSDFIFRNLPLIRPFLNDNRIQLIFSGKGHPLDDEGKKIVANLIAMTKIFPKSVVFLENYDMEIAQYMTQGCDVWLNNPQRPLEASGTSGMKAAVNGVLNLSILDGWWPEACIHGVNGWQFGDGYTGPDQDEHDLQALYKVLFDEVVPDKFSAKRMLEEYHKLMYSYTWQ